jgi:two-component system cell cycle sensor histidine kinase PleC
VLIAAKEQAESAARLAEEAMRQAQAADRAKSQFLATMTHELRTPLNAIIGFSEILTAAPRPAEIPAYAKYIHDSGTQLLGMLNGALDLARIEAGKLQLEEQDVALDELLDAAIRPLRKLADEKSVAIMFGMVVERLVCIDPTKMAQVFVNLLSNAIKFTPEGGSIEIESDLTQAGELSIVVRDTGQGIPDEDLERVQRPFGQAGDHLTRQNGGLGLGLPIACALVKMHGGELTLASEVGVGTTVEIRLPADRVRPLAAARAA